MPGRKLLQVTPANRRKPVIRENHSKAAQSANVTSIALVCRLLTVKELIRVSQTCKLWQAAAESPITFFLTWSEHQIPFKPFELRFVGPKLDLSGTWSKQLRPPESRLLSQFRHVNFGRLLVNPRLPHTPQAANSPLISSMQKVQVAIMVMDMDPSALFDTFKQVLSRSLRILDITMSEGVQPLMQLSSTLQGLTHLGLVWIEIAEGASVFEEQFATWINQLPSLEVLTLEDRRDYQPPCLTGYDWVELVEIDTHHPSLRVIDCRFPVLVSSFDLVQPRANTVGWTHPTCKRIQSIAIATFHKMEEILFILERFPSLTELRIQSSLLMAEKMTPEVRAAFSQWPKHIREQLVNLSFASPSVSRICHLLAAAGLDAVQLVELSAPVSETLSSAASTADFQALCRGLPNCTELRLNFGLTRWNVEDLSPFAAMPKLEKLFGFSWPVHVTSARSLSTLAVAFPSLKSLHVVGSSLELPLANYYLGLLSLPNLESVEWLEFPQMSKTKMKEYFDRYAQEPEMGISNELQCCLDEHRCTYSVTGMTNSYQANQRCLTCAPDRRSGEKVVCGSCAVNCHSGHELMPSDVGRISCDCGGGGLGHNVCKLIALGPPTNTKILQQRPAPTSNRHLKRQALRRAELHECFTEYTAEGKEIEESSSSSSSSRSVTPPLIRPAAAKIWLPSHDVVAPDGQFPGLDELARLLADDSFEQDPPPEAPALTVREVQPKSIAATPPFAWKPDATFTFSSSDAATNPFMSSSVIPGTIAPLAPLNHTFHPSTSTTKSATAVPTPAPTSQRLSSQYLEARFALTAGLDDGTSHSSGGRRSLVFGSSAVLSISPKSSPVRPKSLRDSSLDSPGISASNSHSSVGSDADDLSDDARRHHQSNEQLSTKRRQASAAKEANGGKSITKRPSVDFARQESSAASPTLSHAQAFHPTPAPPMVRIPSIPETGALGAEFHLDSTMASQNAGVQPKSSPLPSPGTSAKPSPSASPLSSPKPGPSPTRNSRTSRPKVTNGAPVDTLQHVVWQNASLFQPQLSVAPKRAARLSLKLSKPIMGLHSHVPSGASTPSSNSSSSSFASPPQVQQSEDDELASILMEIGGDVPPEAPVLTHADSTSSSSGAPTLSHADSLNSGASSISSRLIPDPLLLLAGCRNGVERVVLDVCELASIPCRGLCFHDTPSSVHKAHPEAEAKGITLRFDSDLPPPKHYGLKKMYNWNYAPEERCAEEMAAASDVTVILTIPHPTSKLSQTTGLIDRLESGEIECAHHFVYVMNHRDDAATAMRIKFETFMKDVMETRDPVLAATEPFRLHITGASERELPGASRLAAPIVDHILSTTICQLVGDDENHPLSRAPSGFSRAPSGF